LEERIDDGGTVETITYTLGHDVIAQARGTGDEAVRYLLYDGHGSTRQLYGYDSQSSGDAVVGSFSYDAYGVMLQGADAFPPSGSGTPGVTPPQTTSLLYAGEYFDATAQHYYNRARWYNPYNGRFNRMDPFAGSPKDPQSLHRYLYAHCNPVNGIDPSGRMTTCGSDGGEFYNLRDGA